MFATYKMFIKPKVDAAKQFAIDHPTVVACTATAVVASALTRKYDIELTRNLFYELGRQNAVTALQNTVLLDYINEKGLGDEVRDHIVKMGEELREQG